MATRVGLKKIFISAPYVEAMFQIWWRSVHKWRHSVVHRCQRLDTGDRTRQVIFSARQHDYMFPKIYIYSALYAIARPSVRLSVHHMGGSVKNGW